MPHVTLHTPFKSKNFTVQNRFYKAAMSEILANENHAPTEIMVKLYRRWAQGQPGLLITGNVMIDRRALGEPRNVVVEDTRDIDMLTAWAEAGNQNGTQIWMQINHPGKQSPKSLSPHPVAPSAIPLTGNIASYFAPPRALTQEEIREIVQRFATTAAIAQEAGFAGVQIHAAHGYLISQFLSPHHNQRTDEYGGSLENRMRFLEEVYEAIRQKTGQDFPIGIKLNSADFQQGGFSEEESMQVMKKMEDIGIDLIEISGGNYESPKMMQGTKRTQEREAYFLDFAERVRKLLKTPLVVTGGFRTEKAMQEALESGATDLVGLARPFALNPDLPKAIAKGTYRPIFVNPMQTRRSLSDKNTKSLLALFWYQQQFLLIGKGKKPDLYLSPIKVIFKSFLRNGWNIFNFRRG